MIKFKLPLLATIALASFTSAYANETLTVAASSSPHAEILNYVKDDLKKEGVDLIVREFTDYVQPNIVTFDKQVDINFFQHLPYLDAFNKDRGFNLVPAFSIILTPLVLFSNKVKKPQDIRKGAIVAIPNDPTNGARALLLLQQYGLIKLKDPKNVLSTKRDIVENPKRIKIKEVEAPNLPRIVADVDLAAVNVNYALKAGLDPVNGSIGVEAVDPNSPWNNYVVTRPDNAHLESVAKLKKAIYTQKVYNWILENYKGAVLPTFVPADAPAK